MSAPWTFGRVLSGLLAVFGLIALVAGMFLAFVSGDGEDYFWGRQKVELDPQSWTCEVDATNGTQTCESNIRFGEVVDKGSSFPITVSLLGVGMIGVAVMSRLRPQAPPSVTPSTPPAGGPRTYHANQPAGPPSSPPFPAQQQQNYPNR